MLLCLGSNPSSAGMAGDGSMQEEKRAGDGIPPAGRALGGYLEIKPSKNKCLHREGGDKRSGIKRIFFCVAFGHCWGIVADFRAPDQCNGDKDPHPAIPSVVKLRETKQGQGGGEFISGFVQVSPNCLCFHFLLCTSRAVPPTPHSELINSC